MGVEWNKEQRAVWEETKTRPCRRCRAVKSWDMFHKNKNSLFGINSVCIDCRKSLSAKNYSNWSNEYRLYHAAKSRSRKKKLAFDIELADIVIPIHCPVLGIELAHKNVGPILPNSPSIDRHDPNKGYTKDNIVIMSWRANMLKNNMTAEEAQKLVEYLRGVV